MIVHKLPETLPYINLYPLGDLHIGSPEFNHEMWKKWKQMVLADPYGKVVLVGDLMDNGLKTSKTDSYTATMQPFDQKEWLKRELKDIIKQDKVLGAIDGNHELRTNQLVGDYILYDVFAKYDIEDLYRPNMAFLKVNLGFKNKERQWSYSIVLGHGASNNKTKNFSYALDGMDVFITGHTHEPNSPWRKKIIIDTKNEIVKEQRFLHLVVPSFLKYGGYGLRGMYMPTANDVIPIIRLSGTEKKIELYWV